MSVKKASPVPLTVITVADCENCGSYVQRSEVTGKWFHVGTGFDECEPK